jgi:hypothetical protein
MRVSRLGLIAIAMVLFAVPATALADTYKFYDLGSANDGRDPLGITSSGTVVIYEGAFSLYQTWTSGTLVNSSATDPGLAYDNGSPCTPAVSPAIGSANVTYASCNGAREVFSTGPFAPSPYANSIFDGPNPSNFVAFHMVDEPFRLNATGDFVFIGDQDIFPSDGEIFEYVTAVPEPSSIFFFAIGFLVAAGIARRHPIAHGSAH